MSKYIFLFFTLIVPGLAQAVVNGQEVLKEDPIAKSLVSIVGGKKQCSGFLIEGVEKKRSLVVTAAHCLFESGTMKKTKNLHVQFGRRFKAPRISRKVTAFHIHPEFRHQIRWFGSSLLGKLALHDIALLEFEGEIPNGFSVAELDASTVLSQGKVWVAGYGALGTKRWRATHAQVEISDKRSRDEVLDLGDSLKTVSRQICVEAKATEGINIVAGDSGGPLYYFNGQNNPQIIGLVAVGRLKVKVPWRKHHEVVKTEITFHAPISQNISWISDVLRELSSEVETQDSTPAGSPEASSS